MTRIETVKLRAGDYKIPVTLFYQDDRVYFQFPYNKILLEEIKQFSGSKWHGYEGGAPVPPEIGSSKVWSVTDARRNIFQLAYLKGENPYARYDAPLLDFEISPREQFYVNAEGKQDTRVLDPFKHQKMMARFGATRRHCVWAAEPGTGKSLAAILLMEWALANFGYGAGPEDWMWVAPRSALRAVERELWIWKSKVKPKLLTYEGLTKLMKEWDGRKAPRGLILDEASRVKNPTAQRSQAAKGLADGMRDDWGMDSFIIPMSGSPAPKAPTDWWHICEVACPGFLREGTFEKFRNRLALIVTKENSTTGGVYPEMVSWLDSDKKCKICAKPEIEHNLGLDDAHAFIAAKNEVTHLYTRMTGLVVPVKKVDCLDLPEKHYREIECKPTATMLRAAKLIKADSKTVIEAMIRLRELSDGFQYQEVQDGVEKCTRCDGIGITTEWVGDVQAADQVTGPCEKCGGSKVQPRMVRTTISVPTPKEDFLKDIIEEHEDYGRLVAYAGFTGSVDRVTQIFQAQEWHVIRVDGRGWSVLDPKGKSVTVDPLSLFQDELLRFPRVGFVGQPGAAGMGLTLTASPSIVFYSNDFNAESRIQAEDRIHRPGADHNRGCTIYDLLCLPTDRLVLDNLRKKVRLQDMSMTGLDQALSGDSERLF